MDSQVALVQNKQPGRGEGRGGVVFYPGHGGIRHFQNQICGFKRPVGAGNASLFNDVGRFSHACRINQPQSQSGHLDGFLHRVPRGSGNIADNGPVISQQGIQQAGFSHIGRSGDRRADAFPQQASAFGSFEEGGQFFLHAPEARQQIGGGVRGNVFIRKINIGLNVGQHMNQVVFQFVHLGADASVQLGLRGFQGQVAPGGNHIHHGFRLGQVHAPVQEGPFCELSRFRWGGPALVEAFQQAVRHQHAAMAGDFHGVFPRITGRSRKPGDERLVNGGSLCVQNAGQRCPARLEAFREGRGGALFQDGHAAGAAHADDGNGSLSCGGGLRGDGAFRVNHGSMDSKKPPPSNLPPS